jgi:glycosyl transferase family 2
MSGATITSQAPRGVTRPTTARPTITVGVCTYNRLAFWERRKLHESLLAQTCTDFELLIIDDGSTDGTLEFLKQWVQGIKSPFRVRLFRSDEAKEIEHPMCGPAANVLFANAAAPVFVQADDDCWLDPRAIGYIRDYRLATDPAVLYGNLIFVDPATEKEIWWDNRRKFADQFGSNNIVQLRREWRADRGAFWCAPTAILRKCGGHSLDRGAYRGCDSRLGLRLRHFIPAYFTAARSMRCWHWGWDWFSQREKRGQIAEIMEHTVSPSVGNIAEPPVVNGGHEFWKSRELLDYAHEVSI